MPDLTVPPGVWTDLPDGSTVLNESGANAVVTIEGGEIRFSATMRFRPAPPRRRSVHDTSDLEAYWMSRNEQE